MTMVYSSEYSSIQKVSLSVFSVTKILIYSSVAQGPEEMCLSLEHHQNLSKTSEKMGCFDRVTVSLHIL